MKKSRCAIYTRKSTEEGLEQDFNSLDAQRAACSAYIMSQVHEGWEEISTQYNDGGFSGGSMERPALKVLLEDIKQGKIDTVVVYKVDRLTRALTDFAKIVDMFDQYGVTFVSVTQQFNTTTSMGRLTLNVLLSFAQFEREVTAERIRDKFAASKQKGMWMGGNPPLGYDPENRSLVINESEAAQVNLIYDEFIKLQSMKSLITSLKNQGIFTKKRVRKSGEVSGGKYFTAGPLYHILNNPIYIGKIKHKDKIYDGMHDPIISEDKWNNVQEILSGNRLEHRHQLKAKEPKLLTGLIFNENDAPYTPQHSLKGNKRYNYYVCKTSKELGNLPACDVDKIVIEQTMNALTGDQHLRELSTSDEDYIKLRALSQKAGDIYKNLDQGSLRKLVRALVKKVVIYDSKVDISLSKDAMRDFLHNGDVSLSKKHQENLLQISCEVKLIRIKRKQQLVIHQTGSLDETAINPTILKALSRGYVWNQWLLDGTVKSIKEICRIENLNERYVVQILPLAWLPASKIENILSGNLQFNSLKELLDTV